MLRTIPSYPKLVLGPGPGTQLRIGSAFIGALLLGPKWS